MPEVWFIRHGESTSNAGDVAQDRGSTVLTALGQSQAEAVSLKVNRRPDLIVTTPYVRTGLTARPLLERYSGVPVETWELHEFSALSDDNYINRTWHERRPAMQAFWAKNDPDHVDGSGAESFSAFVGRIQAGLDRLQRRTEGFIVVFAHGYVLQTLRLMLSNPGLSRRDLMKAVPYYMEHSMIENCGIVRVEMDAQGPRLHEEDFRPLDENVHAFEGD